jgi:hypothetical protein
MEAAKSHLINIPGLVLPKGQFRKEDPTGIATLIKYIDNKRNENTKSRNNQKKNSSISSISCSLEDSYERYCHRIDIEKTRILNICNSFCTTSVSQLKRHKCGEHMQNRTYPPAQKISSKPRQVYIEDDETEE